MPEHSGVVRLNNINEQEKADREKEDISRTQKVTGKKVSAIRVKLDEQEKQDIIRLIEDEMTTIVNEYDEIEYYDRLQKSVDEYEGAKETIDFPFASASNRKLLLVTFTVDIVASKGKRQTLTATPVILLEREEEISDADLRDREDYLDFILRKDIKLDELDTIVYRMACLQGSAVVKVPYCYEEDYIVKETTYEPGNIRKFEQKYAKELLNSDSKENRYWARLRDGETITFQEEETQVIFNGVRPYRVDLNKFYARPKIRDFRKHRVIAEQMDFTWADIEQRLNSGYYDEDAVLELEERNGDDYFKKDYRIYEAIVVTKIKGKTRRYVITFDDTTKIILRSIHYPYGHNKIFYVVYTAIPRDDRWLGYGFNERLADVVSIANSFVNSAINEFTLAHTPVILTDDKEFEGERKTIENLSVLPFTKGSQFTPLKFEYSSMDRIQFLQWIIGFGEIISGVSASLMSGRETPADPRAPAAKTAMKLQESNARIEDVVMNLQKGDEQLAEQVDSLYYQYINTEDRFNYTVQNRRELVREIFTKRVRYVCHGSRLSFDKALDLQIAMQTTEYISKFYPEIWQNYDAKFTLLNIIINNSQGSIERNKDVILKPLKDIIDLQKLVRKMKQAMPSGGLAGFSPGGLPEPGAIPGQIQEVPEQLPEAGLGPVEGITQAVPAGI
jgi:hypothetical protein